MLALCLWSLWILSVLLKKFLIRESISNHQFSQDWNDILLAFTSRNEFVCSLLKRFHFYMLKLKILGPKILIEYPEHILHVP